MFVMICEVIRRAYSPAARLNEARAGEVVQKVKDRTVWMGWLDRTTDKEIDNVRRLWPTSLSRYSSMKIPFEMLPGAQRSQLSCLLLLWSDAIPLESGRMKNSVHVKYMQQWRLWDWERVRCTEYSVRTQQTTNKQQTKNKKAETCIASHRIAFHALSFTCLCTVPADVPARLMPVWTNEVTTSMRRRSLTNPTKMPLRN